MYLYELKQTHFRLTKSSAAPCHKHLFQTFPAQNLCAPCWKNFPFLSKIEYCKPQIGVYFTKSLLISSSIVCWDLQLSIKLIRIGPICRCSLRHANLSQISPTDHSLQQRFFSPNSMYLISPPKKLCGKVLRNLRLWFVWQLHDASSFAACLWQWATSNGHGFLRRWGDEIFC